MDSRLIGTVTEKGSILTDIMLDLETWGTDPGCAIRSIGAVVFDPFGDPLAGGSGSEFYCNVDDASQEEIGLFKDPGTVAWWSRQSEQAQNSLLDNQLPILTAIQMFNTWCRAFQYRKVWAQGSNFDPGILEFIFRKYSIVVPWRFHETRDTRTAYHIGRLDTKTVGREGVYHNALDDAKHQALCVQMAIGKARE